jgi:thiamine pyrophosphokinase
MLRKLARDADILAAADSGLMAAEDAGLRPDWIVGDMDSLDDTGRLLKYPAEKIRRFPPAKDFTDTDIVFSLLREKGCDEIWLAGGGGGRMDHLLAIRSMFERDNAPERWFPGNEEIRLLKEGENAGASVPPGSMVSVFPLGRQDWAAESSGLKCPLDGLLWNSGGFSVSNAAESGTFTIRSIKGRFMVIMPMVRGDETNCKGV